MELSGPGLPIGRSGRLAAVGLTGPDGDHAILVREAESSRALLLGGRDGTGRERLVVTPLDQEVEVRIDGDALAVWLGSAPVTGPSPSTPVPGWASAIGLVLLLLVVGFAVIGSAVTFSWLLEAVGG